MRKTMLLNLKSIFESITTVHGTNQFQSKKSQNLVLWSAFMFANFLVTIAYIYAISSRYGNDQIITRINANCKVNEAPFPSVSICNFNLVSLKQTKIITRILRNHNQSQTKIEEFFQSIPQLTHFGKATGKLGNYTQIMNILKEHYFTVETIMEEVHQRCDDLLIYCTFNRKPKSCEEIFTLIKTSDGHCCAFNYAALTEDSVDDISGDGDFENYVDPSGFERKRSSIIVTSESGRGSGLSVVFNVEPTDYPNWSLTPYYGAKVLITDPNDYPEITVLYKYILIGESLDIKVEPRIFRSEDDIRRIPINKRACAFLDEIVLEHTDRYSTETCMTECKMRNYADHCGCIPYKYPRDKTSRFCDFEDLECLNNLRAHRTTEEKPCKPVCYIECRDKMYSITDDVMQLLADFYPQNVTKGRNITELSALQVYFAKPNCNCFTRILLIDFNYFIATYGGVFSLSFGASIISVFEIIYLLISLSLKTLWKYMNYSNKISLKYILFSFSPSPFKLYVSGLTIILLYLLPALVMPCCGSMNFLFSAFPVLFISSLPFSVVKMMSKILYQNIATKFKEFCKHCTLHGFYYFYIKSSWWIYSIWCIIIGSSFLLCVYLGHMIWGKYVDNPTFTVVESTHYPIERISFPAVAICDPELVYMPYTRNVTEILGNNCCEILMKFGPIEAYIGCPVNSGPNENWNKIRKFRAYTDEEINKYYESFGNNKKEDFVMEDYLKKMHAILEDMDYTHEILINKLKKPCSILIQECVWRSKIFDCHKMFREVLTIIGYCCQFDTSYFRTQAEPNTNFAIGTETSEALEMVVNSEKMLYNGTTVDSYVFLYVFDKQNNLSLLDSPITLTPDTFFDVTVSAWTIDSSDEVKSLSLINRKCFLPFDAKMISSSYEICMTIAIVKKVITICRCLPFNYKFEEFDVERYPICNWEKLQCVYQTLDRVQREVRDLISGCYQKCDYVQYGTKAEYVRFSRPIGGHVKGNCRLTIHFAENTCIKYRREVLYTWDQMLANLGGIFGLCLGGSIISIIELLWFVIELLFSTIYRLQRKVVPDKGKKNKVIFIVTENKVASPGKLKRKNTSAKGVNREKHTNFPYLN